MTKKSILINFVILFLSGLFTHFLFFVIGKLQEIASNDNVKDLENIEDFQSTLDISIIFSLIIPGLIFGITLGVITWNTFNNKKWIKFGLTILFSIIANLLSFVLTINLIWKALWENPMFYNSDYTIGILGGIVGGLFISIIPNLTIWKFKLNYIHLLTCLIGGLIGQLMLWPTSDDYKIYFTGFHFWFAIIGLLTIINNKKLRLTLG